MQTTNFNCTTTPVALFTSATTWASTKPASYNEPVAFALRNSGVTIVRIGGASLTSGTGFPISSGGGTFTWDVRTKGEALFIATSASTSNVDVIADMQ